MTVGPADLIHLPFDDSLTLAGVTYACRSLDRFYGRRGRPLAARLWQAVASSAAELAFRRWLETEGAPYSLLDDAPFTQPGHARLVLGGHRLHVSTVLVSQRQQIRLLRHDPEWLLHAQAVLSLAIPMPEPPPEGDLLAFAFLAALETRTWRELRAALAAGLATYLVALPPNPPWGRSLPGRGAGSFVLENLGHPAVSLEVAGRRPDHRFWSDEILLCPGSPVVVAANLKRLLYLHAPCPPTGPISVLDPASTSPWRVSPGDWINLWIYGLETVLAGWATTDEFHNRAALLSAAARSPSQPRSSRSGLALPVGELRPMSELVTRLRQE